MVRFRSSRFKGSRFKGSRFKKSRFKSSGLKGSRFKTIYDHLRNSEIRNTIIENADHTLENPELINANYRKNADRNLEKLRNKNTAIKKMRSAL